MQKGFFLVGLGILLFLAGCVSNQPVCGNDSCENGENKTSCPNDCSAINENGGTQAPECNNLMQIEALKLKIAIEQAVAGEVGKVEIIQPDCASQKMAIKNINDAAKCKADCQSTRNTCLEITFLQNKTVCLEESYTAFLVESPCELVGNTTLTDFSKEIPNGKFIITNVGATAGSLPKLCAYRDAGLTETQFNELFIPAKMKWIAEEKRRETLEALSQRMAQEIDEWINSPSNRVIIPTGSEGKPWKEILADFAELNYASNKIALFFWQQSGNVRIGEVERRYFVNTEQVPNEQFTASAKFITNENCGPQNPDACRGYQIEYSFSNPEKGPKIVVEKVLGPQQKIEYKIPLYQETLNVYPQNNSIETLAVLVAESQ